MNTSKRVIGGLLLAPLAWAFGCGGVSDAEKQLGCNPTSSVGGSGTGGSVGSTGGATGSTGGSAGTTGGATGTGGATPTGGAGGPPPDAGLPMDGPLAGACPSLSTLTLSVHIVMDATWPAGTATSAGSGKIHLWNLAKLNYANGNLSGDETRSCGTILPDFSLNGAG